MERTEGMWTVGTMNANAAQIQIFKQRRWQLAWAMLAAATFAGCQTSDSLQGKVTYNGEPVVKGSITFLSADGEGSGFSAQVADGAYSTDRLKLGQHIAMVRGVENIATASKEESIKQRQNNPHGLATDYIPEDAKGNSQGVDITGGAQTLDFVLEGPPRSG